MPESIMKLSLENLDSIHQTLKSIYEDYLEELKVFNLNENVSTFSSNREVLNRLFDKNGRYLLEVSHIDSFLQYCDLNSSTLTPAQLKCIMVCQQLCKDIKDAAHKVLDWMAKAKAQLNNSGYLITDENIIGQRPSTPSAEYKEDMAYLSDTMLQMYQAYCDIVQEIHKDLLFIDSAMMQVAGKRLDVVNGRKMLIKTEHEMAILLDYALLQYRKDGKNIVERYYNANHNLYSGQKLDVLLAFKNAQFSFLQIIKPIGENIVVVKDLLIDETLVMVNTAIYQFANSQGDYAVLAHYIKAPGFIMAVGAATPVPLISPAGKKMWRIFEKLINNSHNKANLTQAQYFQCITDLFKIVIHEGIAGQVLSPKMPVDYHTMRSDAYNH